MALISPRASSVRSARAGSGIRQQGRHARGKVAFVDPLDPKDANIPGFETCDEVRDGGLAEIHGGQIEYHGLPDEEAGRARQRRVDLFKPGHDRHDGAKHERNIGAAAKTHLLACWFCSRVHDGRLAFSYRMVNDQRS